jgi:hypothetical protein
LAAFPSSALSLLPHCTAIVGAEAEDLIGEEEEDATSGVGEVRVGGFVVIVGAFFKSCEVAKGGGRKAGPRHSFFPITLPVCGGSIAKNSDDGVESVPWEEVIGKFVGVVFDAAFS